MVPCMATESIVVRGARVHNLKNIDFDIPHNTLTVVTGVSGSGKSSLAFDTIYAEGQRRYVESLSAYARQFLERIEKPDVDVIDGIAPAIAIRQKNSSRNPRSTVATVTEIYDYLRLLFARIGKTYCVRCEGEVRKETVDDVAAAVLALPAGTKLNILFPITARSGTSSTNDKPRKSSKRAQAAPSANGGEPLKERLFELRKKGFNRLYQNENVFDFSTPESLLDIDFSKAVYVLVDRLAVSTSIRTRLVEAVEMAYREAGEAVLEAPSTQDGKPLRLRFSEAFECKNCHLKYEEPEPRLFSFNNPFGACPRCQGFGNTIDFDLNLVIPDPQKTLNEGPIDPWTKPKYRQLATEMKRFAKQRGIPLDVPWAELEPAQRDLIMQGERGDFLGLSGFFAHLERKKYKLHVRVFLSRYRGYALCTECQGARLRAEARHVRIEGKNICDIGCMTVESAAEFFAALQLAPAQQKIANEVLDEIRSRLRFMNQVGLEYLTLSRLASTLSGGEAQRIQLATSLGSRLVGALYVLDEPSIGLHSRDTSRLIKILHNLRDLGNTVLVVEHDAEIMRASDRILDLGPGAGEHGGQVVASGVLAEIEANPNSLTGRYLSGQISIPVPTRRRAPGREKLVLRGAEANNLHRIDVEIPMGMLVAITGVSGSGKSTLVHQVLYRAVARALGQSDGADPSGLFKSLTGVERLNDVVLVDQTPIGRTPRSNPITYIKGFDLIRDLFATQPEAKRLSLTPGHFSFNVPGGRCNTCEGDGTVTVEMQFLADVELPCEDCNGTRYQPRILEVQYKGKNIHEVLQMTVKEALRFFAGQA